MKEADGLSEGSPVVAFGCDGVQNGRDDCDGDGRKYSANVEKCFGKGGEMAESGVRGGLRRVETQRAHSPICAIEKRLINVFALKMSDTYVSREDRLTQVQPSRFDSEAMNALKRISTKQANADSFLSGDNPVQSPLFIEISRRLNKS